MVKRILIVGWVFLFGGMFLLMAFPKLALHIPHPEYIRYFLLTFVPFSAVYGLVWVYRRGMKRAKN